MPNKAANSHIHPIGSLQANSGGHFRAIFEQAAVGVAQIASLTGEFVLINQKYCDIVGYSDEEMRHKTFQQITHPDDLEADLGQMRRLLAGEIRSFSLEKRYYRKDGQLVWVNLTVSPMWPPGASPDYHIAVVEDITARKQAEARLREVQQIARLGNWSLDLETKRLQWSDEVYRIFNLQPQEFASTYEAFLEMVHPADRQAVHETYIQAVENHTPYQIVHRILLNDGSVKYVQESCQTFYDAEDRPLYSVGAVQDITERKQAEETICQALAQKDALLHELYHRTRNNMQVMSALLQMQSQQSQDAHLQAALADAENRIHTMALVHQKLYEARDPSHLNLKEYITDLLALLLAGRRVPPGQIQVQTEMQDVLTLMDVAIPCGLVINELLSNSLRHAFPDGRAGEIRIRLSRISQHEILLCYSDNGVGLPPGFEPRRAGRMGLQVIYALVEKQLHGQAHFDSENGLHCCLSFRDDGYQARV